MIILGGSIQIHSFVLKIHKTGGKNHGGKKSKIHQKSKEKERLIP